VASRYSLLVIRTRGSGVRVDGLGRETQHNGALWLVPGRIARTSTPIASTPRILPQRSVGQCQTHREAVSPQLAPGDAIFFHKQYLHSAGKNQSDAVKFSLVYTYHGRSNTARPGTRSASNPRSSCRDNRSPSSYLPSSLRRQVALGFDGEIVPLLPVFQAACHTPCASWADPPRRRKHAAAVAAHRPP